jgi:hypothetical protein
MSILESIKSINAYPIPDSTIFEIATRRGIELSDVVSKAILTSAQYRLAKADVLRWLALAPDVSQAGISYRFTDKDKAKFLQDANDTYEEEDDDNYEKAIYGYKGSRL